MKNIISILLIVTVFIAFQACDNDESQTGTIRLSLTDAPLDNPEIVGVNLAVIRVDIRGDEGWEVLESFEEPVNIDLLEYREGNAYLLTEQTIAAGKYSEIRLVLDIAEHEGGDAANKGTYLIYSDGTTEPLFVPSGAQSGYKAKGEFVLPPDGVVGLTMDFDARRAVVEAGSTGKYILKPVIRLVADEDVALIEGTVSTETEYPLIRVFAYRDGTYDESETIAEPGDVEFPNAVTSSTVDENMQFTLAFMESGIYDLVAAVYDENGDFVSVITNIEDVELDAGQILTLPVDLP